MSIPFSDLAGNHHDLGIIRARSGRGVVGVLVDAVDLPLVGGWTWHLDTNGYPSASAPRNGNRPRKVYMHRLILGLEPGDPRLGDHINRNKLDNRRANLRAVTRVQSGQNVSGYGRASRHRGVSFRAGKWEAKVHTQGKNHYLGRFASEEEAGAAARAFRLAHMPYSVETAVS